MLNLLSLKDIGGLLMVQNSGNGPNSPSGQNGLNGSGSGTGPSGEMLSQFGSNPWQGFAHSEHRADEYESLLRTLRFAMIQLNKFWVEINAFPVFMNELKGASIREIERLLVWLETSPRWADVLAQPRLIPELKQPAVRAALAEFSECVRRSRALRGAMTELQFSEFLGISALQEAQPHLGSAISLFRHLSLDQGRPGDVDARIADVTTRLSRNHRLQGFFSRLAKDCGIPEAMSLREAGRVFQVADYVRRTKNETLSWRKPQILGSNQRIRIEAWADRARPSIDARKKLGAHFKLGAAVDSERLRSIGAALRGGGAFRLFNGSYKEALKHYHDLVMLDPSSKSPPKESVDAMANQLCEWAAYLEVKTAFEGNPEARAFFAPSFKGIDTDFQGALAANAWAASLRCELKIDDASTQEGARDAAFCAQLIEWVFNAPDLKLHAVAAICSGEEARACQGILLETEYAAGREFTQIASEDQAKLLESTRLRDHLTVLAWREDVPLSRLLELRLLLEERLSLVRRLDAWDQAKVTLKNFFAGEDTDLLPIEAARAYVEYIEAAALPESLRNSFLTAYGPARLLDTRSLVAPAQNGLAQVKDHLGRLDVATHGQSRMLENDPLLDLVTRIQFALKHPQALGEWVEKMKADARWKM